MAKIRINFSGVNSANRDLKKLLKQMEDVEETLSQLRRRVDSDIQSRYQIGKQLKNADTAAAAVRSRGKRLSGLVDQAVEQYSSTEQWLNRHTPDNGSV